MGGMSKSKSTQVLTPNNDLLTTNAARAQTLANTPVTPYAGHLDLSQPMGTASALSGYQPQQVSTAQSVSQDQIQHYMNPWENDVVGASLADIERARQTALMQGQTAAVAAGAFGGSRHGVADSLTNGEYGRAAASTAAGLRSQGFTNAVGWGQSDLARLLQASTANQQADLAGAGVRSQAAGLLGQMQQQSYQADYDEWLRQQNDAAAKQSLLNQSYGLLYNAPLTTQKSSSFNIENPFNSLHIPQTT